MEDDAYFVIDVWLVELSWVEILFRGKVWKSGSGTISFKARRERQISKSVARLSPRIRQQKSLSSARSTNKSLLCVSIHAHKSIHKVWHVQERELVYAAKLGKIVFCFMLEKLTQDEIGHEIGFIMGNCVYKQYYKDPKSKEPKKDVRHVNWYIDYFDEAYQLIKSNLKFILIFILILKFKT